MGYFNTLIFFTGILLLPDNIQARGPLRPTLPVRHHRLRLHQRVYRPADVVLVAAVWSPAATSRVRVVGGCDTGVLGCGFTVYGNCFGISVAILC